jgi:hypothetical protein
LRLLSETHSTISDLVETNDNAANILSVSKYICVHGQFSTRQVAADAFDERVSIVREFGFIRRLCACSIATMTNEIQIVLDRVCDVLSLPIWNLVELEDRLVKRIEINIA